MLTVDRATPHFSRWRSFTFEGYSLLVSRAQVHTLLQRRSYRVALACEAIVKEGWWALAHLMPVTALEQWWRTVVAMAVPAVLMTHKVGHGSAASQGS